MKYIVFMMSLLTLVACDQTNDKDEQPSPPTNNASAEAEADNPLLKMQEDTVKRAEDAVNLATDKQQQALDNIDQY